MFFLFTVRNGGVSPKIEDEAMDYEDGNATVNCSGINVNNTGVNVNNTDYEEDVKCGRPCGKPCPEAHSLNTGKPGKTAKPEEVAAEEDYEEEEEETSSDEEKIMRLYNELKVELDEISGKVDKANETRPHACQSFNLKYLECSVSV